MKMSRAEKKVILPALCMVPEGNKIALFCPPYKIKKYHNLLFFSLRFNLTITNTSKISKFKMNEDHWESLSPWDELDFEYLSQPGENLLNCGQNHLMELRHLRPLRSGIGFLSFRNSGS